MKKAFTTTVQRIANKRQDASRRCLNTAANGGSKTHMSTLPLAETGWESPSVNHDYTTRQQQPTEYYSSSFEGALNNLFEINKLGRNTAGFCNFEEVVRSALTPTAQVCTCHLCGQTKYLDELCQSCAVAKYGC